MKLIATILNSSEKVLSRFVALGEGNVSIYDNLKKSSHRKYIFGPSK